MRKVWHQLKVFERKKFRFRKKKVLAPILILKLELVPNPSASSKNVLDTFKNFWQCSIFFIRGKVKYDFWLWSKKFELDQKILNSDKKNLSIVNVFLNYIEDGIDIGFDSWCQNLVSVVHYSIKNLENGSDIKIVLMLFWVWNTQSYHS